MWTGKMKAAGPAMVLALAALALGGCGSSGTDTTTKPPPPPVSAATADRLARLSDRVASDLYAGETCDAAYAADDLHAAVEESDLSQTLRPGVEEVAGDLVDEVNCPPPPPPEKKKPEEKKPKEKKPKHQGDQKNGNDQGPHPPGHNGGIPPGHAKLKGEPE
jgi:hypothetical protein